MITTLPPQEELKKRGRRTYYRQPIAERFYSHIIINEDNGCWEWDGPPGSSGYGWFSLTSSTHMASHRVSYLLTHNGIPENLEVLHTCDNKICVRPDHLFLGTQQDNVDDMIEKGRANYARGSQSGAAKLMEQDVVTIRQMADNGIALKIIASIYSLDGSTISGIVHGKYWSHVEGPLQESLKIRGDRHNLAKLTSENIPTIYTMHKAGITQKVIASFFGVTQATISCVLRGVTWSHISQDTDQ